MLKNQLQALTDIGLSLSAAKVYICFMADYPKIYGLGARAVTLRLGDNGWEMSQSSYSRAIKELEVKGFIEYRHELGRAKYYKGVKLSRAMENYAVYQRMAIIDLLADFVELEAQVMD